MAPTIIGGHRMAGALTKPAVGEFMDSITASELGLGFEQVEVDAHHRWSGKNNATPIRSELDLVIVSIRRQDGETLFNPSGSVRVEVGDILIAIGREESLTKLNALTRGICEFQVSGFRFRGSRQRQEPT